MVVDKIKKLANQIFEKILDHESPSLTMPIRSLNNVEYDSNIGYFKLAGKFKGRALTASTVKTFAQTLLMMNESKNVVERKDMMTKREAYYVSKNWGDARFKEQPESDTVMDDVEAMLMVNREQLGFVPEEKGGDVAGQLVVVDKDPDTNEKIKIDV